MASMLDVPRLNSLHSFTVWGPRPSVCNGLPPALCGCPSTYIPDTVQDSLTCLCNCRADVWTGALLMYLLYLLTYLLALTASRLHTTWPARDWCRHRAFTLVVTLSDGRAVSDWWKWVAAARDQWDSQRDVSWWPGGWSVCCAHKSTDIATVIRQRPTLPSITPAACHGTCLSCLTWNNLALSKTVYNMRLAIYIWEPDKTRQFQQSAGLQGDSNVYIIPYKMTSVTQTQLIDTNSRDSQPGIFRGTVSKLTTVVLCCKLEFHENPPHSDIFDGIYTLSLCRMTSWKRSGQLR